MASCGTLSIGGSAVQASDTQLVAPSGCCRVVRDVVVSSSSGSVDSGLGVVRYDGDDLSSAGDASSLGSADSGGQPAEEVCEMAVGALTMTDSTANIGIFKNYVIVCDGKDELPALPGLGGLAPGLTPGLVLKDSQAKAQPVTGGEATQPRKASFAGRKYLRWPWALLPSAAVSTVILVIIFLTLLLAPPRDQRDDSDPSQPIILPNGVEYASRSVWGALPPKRPMPALALPITAVIIHHTATAACYSTKACLEKIPSMQRHQMDGEGRDWADIGYNFLVGGDGVVYEGRGWDHVGGHFEKEVWSAPTLGLAVIGNFVRTTPPAEQLQELRKFLAWAVTTGKVASDYRLYGVCQLKATQSPGLQLMAQLRTWPHWDNYMKQPNVSCTE